MTEPEAAFDRWGVRGLILLSVLALGLLFWLIYGYRPASDPGSHWAWLPSFNAFCNGLSTVFVLNGLYWIKRGRHRAHGIFMIMAMAASALFLVGYITHHSLHGDTRFLTQGWLRPSYFFILITHVVLSMAALPLVLITVFFAARRRWERHRRLARWTYPIWLYVSVTGVLVFVFLRFLNSPAT